MATNADQRKWRQIRVSADQRKWRQIPISAVSKRAVVLTAPFVVFVVVPVSPQQTGLVRRRPGHPEQQFTGAWPVGWLRWFRVGHSDDGGERDGPGALPIKGQPEHDRWAAAPRKYAVLPCGQPRFWVSGYCKRWWIQGSFDSSYSRSLNVKTWPRNSILSLNTSKYVRLMHLSQHKLCTKKMELALEVKCISTFTEFTRPWRRTLTNGSDVKYVLPRCREQQTWVSGGKLQSGPGCSKASPGLWKFFSILEPANRMNLCGKKNRGRVFQSPIRLI